MRKNLLSSVGKVSLIVTGLITGAASKILWLYKPEK
ncbi:hypothetical protein Ccel_3456 [Ruminiclostridium cellulolyticum H10]|uniref:Uncharacterized protein n=1 Tax=Ruminiclostridium cellulolyticum (strain ATCC 35319 / DSM 5812 / JCM 6584 / H10) TaxID=394503 RepID=B8I1V9_RUMCH|nr:hypothetical protein Ccel_3456 [Ruminiclostridium cellulolyticum H10]